MPVESFKHGGVVAIAVASLAFWWMVHSQPRGRAASISQHAGAQRHTYWVFAGVLTFAGGAFWLFLIEWLGPTLGVPLVFYLFVILGALFQLITGWVPDHGNGDTSSRIHGLAAFSMAAMMMLLAGCIVIATHVATVPRVLAGLAFVAMGVFWYLFLFVKRTHQHFLVYQSAYIASFYLTVIVATYWP